MNLLLGTHVALWAITNSPKLPAKARDLIEAPANNGWVSVAEHLGDRNQALARPR